MSYQPQPGELGHLTVRARYSPAHPGSTACYEVEAVHVDNDGETTWLAVGGWMGNVSRGIVSFVPLPLPSEVGSMILARVPRFADGEPVLLKLIVVDNPEHPRHGSEQWVVSGAWDWIDRGDIPPGWVQIDPATLLPIGVRS